MAGGGGGRGNVGGARVLESEQMDGRVKNPAGDRALISRRDVIARRGAAENLHLFIARVISHIRDELPIRRDHPGIYNTLDALHVTRHVAEYIAYT